MLLACIISFVQRHAKLYVLLSCIVRRSRAEHLMSWGTLDRTFWVVMRSIHFAHYKNPLPVLRCAIGALSQKPARSIFAHLHSDPAFAAILWRRGNISSDFFPNRGYLFRVLVVLKRYPKSSLPGSWQLRPRVSHFRFRLRVSSGKLTFGWNVGPCSVLNNWTELNWTRFV